MSTRRRGRSAGQVSNSPPEGEGWIWRTGAMLKSEANRALGINARRVLDALMNEHLAHAGTENGRLFAPYNQLDRVWGVTRSEIRAAIEELQAFGWIDVQEGDRLGGRSTPSRYALTWLPVFGPDRCAERIATNRWKCITRENVENFCAERRRRKSFKKVRKVARNKNYPKAATAVGAEI